MILDAISEERLKEVHPVLARRVIYLLSSLKCQDDPRVSAGIRTVAQQNQLWRIGRDDAGKVVGRTVTDAVGTQSNHVLGLAVDIAFLKDGECNWDSYGFDEMADKAQAFGLRSGKWWGDRPHLELIEVPAKPTGEMQQTYIDAGVEAVWQMFPDIK